MSDRIRVAAIGAVIDIDASSRGQGFAGRVRAAWADALTPHDAPQRAVVRAREHGDDDAALAALSSDVTLAALALRRGDALWMMHAAGLADADGRVVVLSAPSGTGKTTAARRLSRRYAYVSDETVGVAADGTVVAYRKPLSVIEAASPHKVQVAPSSLHPGAPLAGALRVAAVVVLDRRPDGPDSPVVERLDLAQALELLAPQTSYLSDAPHPLHLIRDVLDRVGGAVRVRYREAETLDGVVAALLDGAETGAVPHRAAASPVPDAREGAPGTLVRTPVVDALDLGDGRLALLRRAADGSSVHVLDGIGPAVWRAADGRPLDAVTADVVAAHGRPDGADAAVLVAAAAEALRADGLLRRVAQT
ncbi:hypothetical protein [Microbacterium paraoxydans]|uniref:Coenzyme PQQ synthesis protein D (PqqD) n=1 Tax=Microbacterium paraoxydans TaxID=199592 RepID=A0ABS5IJX5_9MICO|nr:hypothetical protein [Microbacterium paraoxydans]MBS0023272.1 hypothetical protein [Microbacterium paraoxydans]